MVRSRVALLLLAASFASASASAAPTREHHGGNPTAVTGTYAITFNLNILSALPANATIVCKARIAPAGNSEYNPQATAVPVEAASGVASISGSTATCAVEIPFSWTVETTRNGVSLSYEIDAVNASGSLPAVVRTSAQQSAPQPYPSSGNTSNVSLNVTF